jgi:dipeptidyl aminopeptidase/acylaminoacyl peptidase
MTTKRCDEDLGGLTLRQLLAFQGSVSPAFFGGGDSPVWLPDGSGILFKSGMGGSTNVWRADLETGLIERLTVSLGSVPFIQRSSLIDCSPDGRWISYVGDRDNYTDREYSSRVELWLQPMDGGPPVQLTSLGGQINAYSWSPDSRAIVFSGTRYGRYDIYKVSVPSGDVERLTDDVLYQVYPVFTPSGEHILYVQMNESWTDHEIRTMTAEGEPVRSITTDTDFFDYIYGRRFGYPLIPPDGEPVAFPSYRSGWINYWSMPLAGGDPAPIWPEEHDQTEGTFSPDGQSFAFVSNDNGTGRLVVVSMGGERSARVLVDPVQGVVSRPVWSPDGDRLAYILSTPNSPADLYVVSLEDGTTRQLTSSPLSQTLQPRLSAPEKVTYESFDGLEISAYLYSPPDRAPGDRFPGLVFVHGGPTSQFADTYYPQVQYFIRKGYVVLMPNIRGSSGYGKEFEDLNNQDWGHDDLRDVIAGVDYLKTLDYVDGSKMAIHGTSYGGCMSMSAVAFAPGVFQAAVPHAGYGDWLDFTQEQELRHRQLLRYEFGGWPEEAEEVYRRCSPIYKVADATTPVFLVHGEGEYPRSDASLQFARALEANYKAYEYKIYPNECYYVQSMQNLCEMYPDIVDFLDRYLDR